MQLEIFGCVCTLIMHDDPSILHEAERERLETWANHTARSLGYANWVDAYHALPSFSKASLREAKPKSEEPPFLSRLWLCLSAPKRWLLRLAVGHAAIGLNKRHNCKISQEAAWRLFDISNHLWDQEFSRYNTKPDEPCN